ncbi:folliculin-interacting protein 2-like isoform X1 [Biomphalaria glabrata]|uniref:Folliculin-interacting protein 2-like isoform X1 n=1 Tax=Biomphalaria glabrata TaxID=6526 RepID=A0A9U8EE83_BIOGL|nr:folliculin-interacting protein 2-like isoform X1 [Biomphalaria glabrata]
MALFQRIFPSKKNSRNHNNSRGNEGIQKTVPPKLDKSKIRLVIYADSERGRIPYFDSDAITLVDENTTKQNVIKSAPKTVRAKGLNYCGQKDALVPQQKQPPKYHFSRLGSDVKVLEEMMFGTAAMAFKGSTLKVHLLRCPPKLMISKVFIPEKPCRDSFGDVESESSSLPGSSADHSSEEFFYSINPKEKHSKYGTKSLNLSKSIPVDVPTKDISDNSTDDDSGRASFTSSGSMRASFPSPGNNSISSYNSLHRRWMRAQTTMLDSFHRKQIQEANNFVEGSVRRPNKCKLAIGILFGSYDEKDEENHNLFQSFFFSHFALIESHVEKLRSIVEKAYFNKRNFLPSIVEALDNFRDALYDLYMAPRLQEPVWLTLMPSNTYKTKLCEKFMKVFVNLVVKYDNKNCKFFMSTLLSAVLTQHLAWVATVTPADCIPSNTYLDKHTAKWVDTLAKTHPYNPLWAQLGDLFGAIGFPLKISRTVVVGKKADVVKDFLYILSYFIRCSEIHENSDPQCLAKIVNDNYFDASLSPTASEKTLYLEGSHLDGNISPSFCRQTSANSLGKSAGRPTGMLNDVIVEHSESALDLMNDSPTPKKRPECGFSKVDWSSEAQQVDQILDYESDSLPSTPLIIEHKHSKSVDIFKAYSVKQSASENQHKAQTVLNNDSNSSELYPMGMSELHNYHPNSMPACSLASAKPLESPKLERVANVAAAASQRKIDFFDNTGQHIIRSESFSEGKVRSTLAKRLEGTDLQMTKSTIGSDEHADEACGKKSDADSESRKDAVEHCPRTNFSRQASTDQKPPSGRPTSLVRCRSSTPTELSRRRHLSSTSSIDYDAFDPMIHCKEIKLPFAPSDSGQWHIKAFDRNFGHSLLASYTDHYMSDFVLHGTSDTDFIGRLQNDLQMTVKHSVLDEPIDEAVCVIANTDTWTVEVVSSKMLNTSPSACTTWTSSQLVADMIESVVEISKLKMSSEFCLMHLEDRLQEIYFKSLMVSECIHTTRSINQRELTTMLGFETSDLPLLLAVAKTHTPELIMKVL